MLLFRALLASLLLAATAAWPQQSTRPMMDVTSVRPQPAMSPEEALAMLETAEPDARFSATLSVPQGTTLGDIRQAVDLLEVPRVLADIQLMAGPRSVGMGTFYDQQTSWNWGVCQILATAAFGRSSIPGDSPDDWPVFTLRVYGSAYQIRELATGAYLPEVAISDINRQSTRAEQRFAEAVRRESRQTIGFPSWYQPPDFCLQFIGLLEAPVLLSSSNRDRVIRGAAVKQRLSELSQDVPVTLSFELARSSSIDFFVELVDTYQIDGFSGELRPPDNNDVVLEAALSVHVSTLAAQAQRTRCWIAYSATQYGTGNAVWTGNRARASLSVASAWELLAHPDVLNPELLGEFSPQDIEQLVEWHHLIDQQSMNFPPGTDVPRECAMLR